jgi:SAM-dependent methyltransferase
VTETSAEEQVRVEGRLASKLLAASDAERPDLYGEAYDRIYEMHLPRRGDTAAEQTFGASPRMLGRLLRLTEPDDDVLEIGCGAGFLAIELARAARSVTGVDASQVILAIARRHVSSLERRPTFRHVSGVHLPFADETFDLAYSIEVLEHLHPDDVPIHLHEVRRVLRPGGGYWLATPNATFAPSVYERFGIEASQPVADVHLKEWTYRELILALDRAGFRGIRSPWRNTRLHRLPLLPADWKAFCEGATSSFPKQLRRGVAFAVGIAHCSLVASK